MPSLVCARPVLPCPVVSGFAMSCSVDNVSCLLNVLVALTIVLSCFCVGLIPLRGFGSVEVRPYPFGIGILFPCKVKGKRGGNYVGVYDRILGFCVSGCSDV